MIALIGIGEVLLRTGRPSQARAQLTTALDLATQTGDRYQQARAHDILARTYHATNEADEARRHWTPALTLFARLGAPEAGDVRARLADIDGAGTTPEAGIAAG